MTILHMLVLVYFFFSSRRRHTSLQGDWSSDVCSSDLCQARHDALLEVAAPDVDAQPRGDIDARPRERPVDALLQIGRASCRERGRTWQVGGAVKNREL